MIQSSPSIVPTIQRRGDVRFVVVLICVALWATRTTVGGQATATIRGRVISRSGYPIEGALVRATVIRFHDGRQRIAEMPSAAARTDDHGEYRVDGLSAGRYLVTAVLPSDGPLQLDVRYPPLYPPNPTAPTAIELRTGQALDLDLQMTPLRTAKITGQVLDSKGQPLGAPVLIAPSQRSGALATPISGAVVSSNSRFEFSNVPPGEYVIQAIQPRRNPSTEGEFAGAFVQLNGTCPMSCCGLRRARRSQAG